MARTYIEFNKGWKIFAITILVIAFLVGLFFAIAAIVGHINSMGCIEQIQSWFGVIKTAVEPVEESVDSTANIVRFPARLANVA